MKKVISVLVALEFVWMFAVPDFARAGQEKTFKSILNNIKDPKEGRAILLKGLANTDSVLVVEDWEKDLKKYSSNGKIETWISQKLFTRGDMHFVWTIPKIKKHIHLAYEYLEVTLQETIAIAASRDPNHPQNLIDPSFATNQTYYNESYKGTLEDVKKVEKHLFEAQKLIDTIKDSIVLKLIEKDKKNKKISLRKTLRIFFKKFT